MQERKIDNFLQFGRRGRTAIVMINEGKGDDGSSVTVSAYTAIRIAREIIDYFGACDGCCDKR